jgi:hypothetical protein
MRKGPDRLYPPFYVIVTNIAFEKKQRIIVMELQTLRRNLLPPSEDQERWWPTANVHDVIS